MDKNWELFLLFSLTLMLRLSLRILLSLKELASVSKILHTLQRLSLDHVYVDTAFCKDDATISFKVGLRKSLAYAEGGQVVMSPLGHIFNITYIYGNAWKEINHFAV